MQKTFKLNKDKKIELSQTELKEILDKVFWQGYYKGKGLSWTYTTPWTYTPSWVSCGTIDTKFTSPSSITISNDTATIEIGE